MDWDSECDVAERGPAPANALDRFIATGAPGDKPAGSAKSAKNSQPRPLKLLVLDEPEDVGTIRRVLRKAAMRCVIKTAAQREAFIAALESYRPDVVIADDRVADFRAGAALAHVRHVHPEIPVVIVTGRLGEEAAIELLAAGAKDYLLKDNLLRLPSAIERVIAMERGIRARKAAERAVRAANELLHATERIAQIGGFDWDMVNDRLVWTDGLFLIFGRSPESFAPSLRSFLECVHPADRARIEAAVDAVAAGFEALDLEFRILRPDGVPRVLHSRGEVVCNRSGKPLRMTGTSQDITERKQAEEALRASEERFRLLIEQAPDAIVLYDFDKNRFIAANLAAERLFACGREEIVRHGPPHFYAAEQPDEQPVARSFADHNRRALAGEQITYERRIRNALGQERLCEVTLVRLPGEQQRLLRASFVDITEQRAAELSLRRLNRTLRTLSRGNETLVHVDNEPELLKEMCRVIVETGGYRMAWIGLAEDDAEKSVVPAASAGEVGGYLDDARISWAEGPRGNGPHGRAIRSGKPQVTQDIAADPSMAPWREAARTCGFASSVVFPLRDGSRTFAALMIYSAEPDAFDADQFNLLQELAGDLAFGIRSLRTHAAREALDKRWRTSLEATIGAIASTVEVRDPYTAGHQQRAARLAVAIARQMGLPDHRIEGLYLAGIVHDVGKINIPAEILSKPGKLSSLQYQLIQAHAEAGYEIVKGIDFPWPIAEIIRQHHERLDGSGYPRGLTAETILLEAKILAVADVVEAMMSHRPYRAALGADAALAEIGRGRGRIYDAAAVDACDQLIRQKSFAFE